VKARGCRPQFCQLLLCKGQQQLLGALQYTCQVYDGAWHSRVIKHYVCQSPQPLMGALCRPTWLAWVPLGRAPTASNTAICRASLGWRAWTAIIAAGRWVARAGTDRGRGRAGLSDLLPTAAAA
jgi:hypothetical protein